MKKNLPSIAIILLIILSFVSCGKAEEFGKLTTERIENVEFGIPENFFMVEDDTESEYDDQYNIFNTYKKESNGDESSMIFVSTADTDYKNTEIDTIATSMLKDADCDISDIETIDLNNTVGKLFTLPSIEGYNEHTFIFIEGKELFRISLTTNNNLEQSHFKDIVNSVKILSKIDSVCFEVPNTYEKLTRSEQKDLMDEETIKELKDSVSFYADIDGDNTILNVCCRDTNYSNINNYVKSFDGHIVETIDISTTKGLIVNNEDADNYNNYILYFIKNKIVYSFDMFSESETCIDDLNKLAKTIIFI